MTLRSLEVFLAVVECGSMRAAAERLYISQPSVSGAVADLEAEYGVRLFERLGRRLYLTGEGGQLAGYARRMLALRGELERQLRGAGEALPLRLGASVTVGSSVMPALVRQLEGPPPYVFVGNTGAVEQKLLVNQLDVGFVEGEIHSPDLLVTPVLRDRLVLICRTGHPLAGRPSVSLRDLAGVPMVLREPESGTRQVLDLEFRRLGVAMSVAWECTNSQTILQAVRAGLGVTLLSPRLLERAPGLAAVPLADGPVERTFSLVLHKDKFISPPLRAFLDRCRELPDRKETMDTIADS